MRAWIKGIYDQHFIYRRPLTEILVYLYYNTGKKRYTYFHNSVVIVPNIYKIVGTLQEFIDMKVAIKNDQKRVNQKARVG